MTTNRALTQQTSRGRDDPVIAGLMARARNGDRQAWDALVDRYAPLVWSICRSHQLEAVYAQDAAQNVWLKLVDQLDNIRDPAALPGWLAATTRRECGRILCAARRPRDAGYPLATGTVPDDHAPAAEQDLLAAGRHAALRGAFGQLPAVCQQLLALLIDDPALSYAEISARLGIPAGSMGPTRRRCLDKLRGHPAITALIDAGTQTATQMHGRSEPKGSSSPCYAFLANPAIQGGASPSPSVRAEFHVRYGASGKHRPTRMAPERISHRSPTSRSR